MNEYGEELLTRGVAEIIGSDMLHERLSRGEKLRVKLGIDPTSPSLHVGRSMPLLKLRDFERAGHQVVFIVGDFTGVVGDTSDKDSERPMLKEEAIRYNMASYMTQVSKLIDVERAEFAYNSSWLGKLTYHEIGEHADCFSVADFIARENIKKRLDTGKRVSLREMLYPLMQGYDSVAVRADVELGGTDQRFNLLAGRTLQTRFGQQPQAAILNPLIVGPDGRKMSSSWGNTINFTDTADDIYGKVMSVRDELIVEYLTLLTRLPMVEVREVEVGIRSGSIHPKEAKMRLARELVTIYHGVDAARLAEEEFVRVFQDSEVPQDAPVVQATVGEALVDVLIRAGVVASKGEFRRLVAGNAIHRLSDGETITDAASAIREPGVYKIGKRRFVRIEVAAGQKA